MARNKYYSYIFISIVAILSAGLLSFVSAVLKPRQEINEAVEKKKNIMIALGSLKRSKKVSQSEIIDLFHKSVEVMVVNNLGKQVALPDAIKAENIDPEIESQKSIESRYLPIYLQKEAGKIEAYCLPVSGKGLWSTIYGYLALEKNLNTIRGLIFYKQAETPGLGAEISTAQFTSKFIGKKIFDGQGKLISIKITKLAMVESSPDFDHSIDGISGATKTCDGVEELLLTGLQTYSAFINNMRLENED